MTQTQTDIATLIELVNQLLLDGEPANISVDTYSGYVGYRPQYVVDAMNETFGTGGWGFEELSSDIMEGEKGALVVAKVKVWLSGAPDFQPTGWGQARVTKGDYGDARKGAQTDAIKKALSYFSIGNRAYQGLLKEGNGNGHAKPAPVTRDQALHDLARPGPAMATPAVRNTLHDSPPSPKQLEEITRLANALGKQVKKPASYKEAHALEAELARESNVRAVAPSN